MAELNILHVLCYMHEEHLHSVGWCIMRDGTVKCVLMVTTDHNTTNMLGPKIDKLTDVNWALINLVFKIICFCKFSHVIYF